MSAPTVFITGAVAGIGRATALTFARAEGGRCVRLWSDTRFAEGHAFYARNGFIRVPAVRFLADVSDSWEFAFRREIV